MIYLLSATPGSGKTLWAVKEIFNRANESEPWNIFSNIDGLKLDTAKPLLKSFDQYPPRSLVVIDEAQKIKHFSKKYKHPVANEFHPEVEFLQTHRHADHLDIIFITQAPRLLNPDVLDMVGTHYHLHRAMGMKMATWWLWRYAATNPNTKSSKAEAEDSGTFTYPKDLFMMYKSSDGGGDTHSKIKIPLKVIQAIWMLLVVLGAFFYFWSQAQSNETENKTDESIETSVPNSASSNDAKVTQSSAVKIEDYCRMGVNIDKPQCITWYQEISDAKKSILESTVYDSNNPYLYNPTVTKEPVDFPRISGVITLSSGKLIAIDQQGNYMPDVSQNDCKKYLNGYRPFDYFKSSPQYIDRVSTSDSEYKNSETSLPDYKLPFDNEQQQQIDSQIANEV